MSTRDTAFTPTRQRDDTAYDMGLRKHMLRVYNYMTAGVLLTGVVALAFTQSGLAEKVFTDKGATLVGWLIILAPLAYVFFLGSAVRTKSLATVQFIYWSFTAVMGLSMSTIFLTYTATSIAGTFFATSAAFAGLSFYGYTTKHDLGPIGSFLLMSLWGLIAAMLINIIIGSEPASYLISAVGIVIFAGLTAYDTQKIKSEYRSGVADEVNEKLAIMGATELYLDFVNLMLHLLRFFGVKKD